MNAQGTLGWLYDRLGHMTSSGATDAISFLKNGKESLARKKYKVRVVTERITGIPRDSFLERLRIIKWGKEQEVNARLAYEFLTGNDVDNVGFVKHPTIKNLGASPDGLILSDGLVEFKCPESTTHIEYILDGVVPEEYKPQMLDQILVTNRDWCDFVSYDPRLDINNRIFIVRYKPTTQEIIEFEKRATEFLREADDLYERLMFGSRKQVEELKGEIKEEIKQQIKQEVKPVNQSTYQGF